MAICYQYARKYYQKQLRHMMQYSLHVQNVEGRVNLDPWGMDNCIGCRIVEYLLSTVFLLCIGPRSATSGQYVGACFLL